MKQLRTYIFIINIFCSLSLLAQNQTAKEETAETKTDSVSYDQRYGLRAGIDIARLVRSFTDDNYQGLEIVADYRLSHRWYLAGEIGSEEKTTDEDWYNFTTKGNYIKAGFDWNAYNNWYGMENIISAGFRYGFSTFSQNINSYTPSTNDPFWNEELLTGSNEDILGEHSGLSAHWIELVMALKVELFHNVYMGASVRLNKMITDKEPSNFDNLWVPGFNKVTDGSSFGVGYNYSISYLIPLYKKTKKPNFDKNSEED
ncbi:hypothetical protein SAMN05216480_101830 [Pustulibacterium marinum]|uniref:Outer membrane protein beta-barrel domain-containing protein n=1 Tax=Pustulibacterium marinum TaxID=1224947 RepID=A0A1I7FBI7_9FLAO|nr:DUF6048 family protein [Pustulibacterium marinum]SFU33623.1 hypothetical protein SAMN05216480_101830 [Pustulibacterium marinum]